MNLSSIVSYLDVTNYPHGFLYLILATFALFLLGQWWFGFKWDGFSLYEYNVYTFRLLSGSIISILGGLGIVIFVMIPRLDEPFEGPGLSLIRTELLFLLPGILGLYLAYKQLQNKREQAKLKP